MVSEEVRSEMVKFVQEYNTNYMQNPLITSFCTFLMIAGGTWVQRFASEKRRKEEDQDRVGLDRDYYCSDCQNTFEVDCPECEGRGFFMVEGKDMAEPRSCKFCDATGKLPCAVCEARQQRAKAMNVDRLPPPKELY
eukprot:CAMPEP_0117756916 /NCGR_PEP_ID=MMETSP0947-20121206/14393_1 /TAXON_ID=44440 /ORGANISM="Chattonella subsalsa, Strain CCMP2191" /LENGTH=136 /DNA_ID=CAMNT_0005576655 /DNA_START=258 /DNA_END=668 /DNA_ORIENTATION=+